MCLLLICLVVLKLSEYLSFMGICVSRTLALALTLYLPAPTPNLYFPILALNMYLLAQVLDLVLPALALNFYLPVLHLTVQVCFSYSVYLYKLSVYLYALAS